MAYVPQNLQIFTAAFCGALAGMGLSDRQINDQSAASYAGLASVAGAFAQAIDTAWTSTRATTLLDVEAVQSESAAYWQDRSPIPDATNTSAATHAAGALAMIATITAGNTYFTAQGITPPPIPGGATGGGNYAADVTALQAVAVGALQPGIRYYVGTFQQYFVWSPTSTVTPNTTTVIQPASGGTGRWLRDFNYTNPAWLTVAAWFIDATNGDDQNNGQQQTNGAPGSYLGPLKTHAEFVRRVGNGTITPPLSATVPNWNECIVNILTDLPDTDPLNMEFQVAQASFVRYTGVLGKTTLYTGSFTAVSALNVAANTMTQVTDSAIGNWTTYLNKRIRITQAGTNLNTIFWVGKDLGAQQARVSMPGTIGWMFTSSPGASTFTPKTPTVGDTFVIESLPTVTLGVMNPRTIPQASSLRIGTVMIGELTARNGVYVESTPANIRRLNFYAAFLDGTTVNCNSVVIDCCINNGMAVTAQTPTLMIAGLVNSTAGLTSSGGNLQLTQMPLLQGSPVSGSGVSISSAAIFDNAAAGVNPGGHAIITGLQISTLQRRGLNGVVSSPVGSDVANLSVIGSGNAGVGLYCAGGASFFYPATTTFKVTGTGGDFKLDSGTTSNVWDQTANAGAGGYLVPRNNTWANLAATVATTGFGGSAHNVQADSHLIQAASS